MLELRSEHKKLVNRYKLAIYYVFHCVDDDDVSLAEFIFYSQFLAVFLACYLNRFRCCWSSAGGFVLLYKRG